MICSSARAAGFILALLPAIYPAFAEQPPIAVVLSDVNQPAHRRANRSDPWAISTLKPELENSPEVTPVSPFRDRLKIGASKVKIKAYSAELGAATLSISTLRAKSFRIDGLSNFAHSRFASFEAYVGIEVPVTTRNAISLTGSWALERRRPSLLIGAHNQFRTANRAISLTWSRNDQIRLSASAFSRQPSGSRSTSERLVDLATGSPRAARGVGLEFTNTLIRGSDKFAFGFDLRQQSSEVNYTANQVSYRPETRGQIFLRAPF